MTVTLLVNQQSSFRRVAFLSAGNLLDLDIEKDPFLPHFSAPLDQIYWGRVVSVEPSHIFVKLTEKEVGLLPLEPSFSKPLEGQALLVQVRREAFPDKGTKNKGTLLTRKIQLGGRYCIFHPFLPKRRLSNRIQDPRVRDRLQRLFPDHEPVTLRTAAASASFEQIQTELICLRQKFMVLEGLSGNAPCMTPYDALPTSHRWIRDLEASEVDAIFVDHDEALREVRTFVVHNRPDLLPLVKKHRGNLFEAYGLEDIWDSLFTDVVDLPGGGNIVLEMTAAALIIDVNQGNKAVRETNKEAILPIIQHLRWRHLGGNIIIDFMGVETALPDRAHLRDLLMQQSAVYHLPLEIYGWSKLGWLEARLPKRRLPLGKRVGEEHL